MRALVLYLTGVLIVASPLVLMPYVYDGSTSTSTCVDSALDTCCVDFKAHVDLDAAPLTLVDSTAQLEATPMESTAATATVLEEFTARNTAQHSEPVPQALDQSFEAEEPQTGGGATTAAERALETGPEESLDADTYTYAVVADSDSYLTLSGADETTATPSDAVVAPANPTPTSPEVDVAESEHQPDTSDVYAYSSVGRLVIDQRENSAAATSGEQQQAVTLDEQIDDERPSNDKVHEALGQFSADVAAELAAPKPVLQASIAPFRAPALLSALLAHPKVATTVAFLGSQNQVLAASGTAATVLVAILSAAVFSVITHKRRVLGRPHSPSASSGAADNPAYTAGLVPAEQQQPQDNAGLGALPTSPLASFVTALRCLHPTAAAPATLPNVEPHAQLTEAAAAAYQPATADEEHGSARANPMRTSSLHLSSTPELLDVTAMKSPDAKTSTALNTLPAQQLGMEQQENAEPLPPAAPTPSGMRRSSRLAGLPPSSPGILLNPLAAGVADLAAGLGSAKGKHGAAARTRELKALQALDENMQDL